MKASHALSLLALVFGQTALAAPATDSASSLGQIFTERSGTPFAQIQHWFAESTPIDFEEMNMDYHIGRCFMAFEQHRPRAAMMSGIVRSNGEDRGPGFPDDRERKAFLFFGSERYGADVFDYFPRMPGGGDGRVEFTNFARESWYNYSLVEDTESLSFTYDMENNLRPDDHFEIRRYEDYLVATDTNLVNQYRYGRYLPAGATLHMCYFFKRVAK